MFDPSFVAVVRRHLPLLPPEADLAPEADLEGLGLDSMATAHLIVDLELDLGLRLPSPALVPATFVNLTSLWREVEKLPRR